jgi:hypothetical protein
MKPLTYAPDARAELLYAIRYYNRQCPGLDEVFRLEFIRVRELVVANPLRCAPDKLGLRKALLQYFPYKRVYLIRQHDIYVVAAAHHKHAPGYWETRHCD